MYKFLTIFLTLFLALFSFTQNFATVYSTTGNNAWQPSTPATQWSTSDTFEIYHKATLYGITLQSGGAIIVKSGGLLTLSWSAVFNSGSSIYVEPGGELKIAQLTVQNYSNDFVIDGSLRTTNGTLVNYAGGVISYNSGASWYLNQFTFTNHGDVILNEDVDWQNGTIQLTSGSMEINSEVRIKNLTFVNSSGSVILGYGQINLLNNSGSFTNLGTINGCSGSGCIPPSTIGNITYLAGVGTDKEFEVVSGGTITEGQIPCDKLVQVLDDVIISSNINIGELIVSPGVTVTINSDNSLTVCDGINNGGEIFIENNGSLVQTSLTNENSGVGTYTLERLGSSSSSTYNSWSSPLESAKIEEVFGGSNPCDIFTFDGVSQSWLFDYPVNYQTSCLGNNVTFPLASVISGGDGNMDVGRGYFAPGAATQTRSISGQVNNGDVFVAVKTTTLGNNPLWDDDDWNLVGNPYPCALDLDAFYLENQGVIDGGFFFWVDNPNNTAYHQSDDYAAYAAEAGTEANGAVARRHVAVGQAFWVYAKQNGVIKFTNNMRVSGNNGNLYKRSEEEGPSFVYLSVKNDSNNFNQCAIGFNENATDLKDDCCDAPKGEAGTGVAIGSIIDGVPFIIQSLEPIYPQETKIVSVFLKSTNAGMHTISADSFQNMGDDYDVLLLDQLNGTITDLKITNYSLHLDAGDYSNRFWVIFKNKRTPLGVNDIIENPNQVTAYQSDNEIIVQLSNSDAGFRSIEVYDVLGKKIIDVTSNNASQEFIDASTLKTGVYIVKSNLNDGSELSVKLVISK